MLASELFAKACGTTNQGDDRCHWCGSKAQRIWPHDDPLVAPFFRNKSSAKCPGHAYICQGCLLYRRKRVTIPFLTEGFRDGQSAALHSLWIEETGFWSLRDKDHLTLYKKLLSPPLRFLLSLKTAACARNEIHLAVANDHALLRADTKLFFTVDNVVHHFTTYELDQAIKQGGTGKEPGVQLLIRFLGKPPVSQAVIPLKGRPPAEQGQAVRKIVAASGMPLKAS